MEKFELTIWQQKQFNFNQKTTEIKYRHVLVRLFVGVCQEDVDQEGENSVQPAHDTYSTNSHVRGKNFWILNLFSRVPFPSWFKFNSKTHSAHFKNIYFFWITTWGSRPNACKEPVLLSRFNLLFIFWLKCSRCVLISS